MIARIWVGHTARQRADDYVEYLLRTGVEFSARSIADAYRRFVLPRFPELRSILFSGGGTYNATLMNRIRALLPELHRNLPPRH